MESKSKILLIPLAAFVAAAMASRTFADEPGTPLAPVVPAAPESTLSTVESMNSELGRLFSGQTTMTIHGNALEYRSVVNGQGFQLVLSVPLFPETQQIQSLPSIGQAHYFLTQTLISHYLGLSRGRHPAVRNFRNDPIIPTTNISPITQMVFFGAEMSAQYDENSSGVHKLLRFRIIPYRGHLLRLTTVATADHPCDERCDRFLNSFHPEMVFIQSVLSSNPQSSGAATP